MVSWAEMRAAVIANPTRGVALPVSRAGTASHSIAVTCSVPAAGAGAAGAAKAAETTFVATDVLSLVMWAESHMYRAASDTERLVMKAERAMSLLVELETAWKTRGGKTRGWVRKHIEEELRPLSVVSTATASASAAVTDARAVWTRVCTERRSAMFVDFVAIMHNLRVAVTATDGKTTMIPQTGGGDGSNDRILQIACERPTPILDPGSGSVWTTAAEWRSRMTKVKWFPPPCVSAQGNPTVAELRELIKVLTGADTGTETDGSRSTLWHTLNWELLMKDLSSI